MDLAVYMALIVLAAVFLVSLFILIVMCKRRANTSKHLRTVKLRFSKTPNENIENIMQLRPLIEKVLDGNQWVYDMTGTLKHCVAILKLCHATTEKLTAEPLSATGAPLNAAILMATKRILPNFNLMIEAMESNHLNVPLLEARASALVSACWTLSFPFILACGDNISSLEAILKEMDTHVESLRDIVSNAEQHILENHTELLKSNRPLSSLIEDTTPLVEKECDKEAADTPSPQSDEAPADPSAS
uniref:Transmembrane protein 98 n=1 Tax=Syphacia muris TaxID=451379 RepID=A0A0N5AZU8_9BILA